MNSDQNIDSLNPSKWIDEHADYLFSYGITRINRRETVEDLVQETFLSALKAKNNIQFKSSVRTWLTSILRNKIFDQYKKAKKSDLTLGGDNEFNNKFFESGGFGMVWKNKSFDQWDMESAHEKSDLFYKMLNLCIKHLSELHQSIFRMKNLEGMDAQEICKLLEISESNYWVITHRSKVKLKKCVESNWFNKSKY